MTPSRAGANSVETVLLLAEVCKWPLKVGTMNGKGRELADGEKYTDAENDSLSVAFSLLRY